MNWFKKASGVHPIELLYPRSLKYLHLKLSSLVEGKLWLKVLIGMFLGIATGILLGPDLNFVERDTSAMIAEWLALPGLLFIRGIQMIVIPLIFASIIKGIAASENINQLKRTGVGVTIFFLASTVGAIVLGLTLAHWVQPGNFVDANQFDTTSQQQEVVQTITTPTAKELPSKIGGLLPTNIFGSMLNGEMLQIVLFTIIIGIALVNLNIEQSRPLLDLFGAVQNVCMTIVQWAMKLAPFAVFGLIAKLTSQFGIQMLTGIGMYMLTVIAGLFLLFVLYTVIIFVLSKQSPFEFIRKVKDVLLLAFSTSSSAAVMPLSMKAAEDRLNIPSSLSQFIIPIGTTINMAGTALYQAIATIFLAQVFDADLSGTALILVIVTIVGASIGSPAVPGVGIAILALILNSVGIPLVGLALILGVDRILDMCRTVLNVTGDLTACVVMNKLVGTEKSSKQRKSEETKRERQREQKGVDVVVSKA